MGTTNGTLKNNPQRSFSLISINIRVLVMILGIILLVALSSLLALSIQQSAFNIDTKRANFKSQVRLTLSLENSVYSSLLPVHDYLITGKTNEQSSYHLFLKTNEKYFRKLSKVPTLSENSAKTLRLARSDYIKIKQLAKEIFNLPNPVGNPKGTSLMKKMDRYQQSMSKNLKAFIASEQSELKNISDKANQSSHRSFVIIEILTASLVIGGVTLSYINRKAL
jgi:CHASE3 domain sensor protein